MKLKAVWSELNWRVAATGADKAVLWATVSTTPMKMFLEYEAEMTDWPYPGEPFMFGGAFEGVRPEVE